MPAPYRIYLVDDDRFLLDMYAVKFRNAGHEVTAFVRDPKKLAIKHSKLRIVEGDVLVLRILIGRVVRLHHRGLHIQLQVRIIQTFQLVREGSFERASTCTSSLALNADMGAARCGKYCAQRPFRRACDALAIGRMRISTSQLSLSRQRYSEKRNDLEQPLFNGEHGDIQASLLVNIGAVSLAHRCQLS